MMRAEFVKVAQGNRQCQFRYWDGVRCGETGLPFGKERCPKHEGRVSQF